MCVCGPAKINWETGSGETYGSGVERKRERRKQNMREHVQGFSVEKQDLRCGHLVPTDDGLRAVDIVARVNN